MQRDPVFLLPYPSGHRIQSEAWEGQEQAREYSPSTTYTSRKEMAWKIVRSLHTMNISEGNFLAKCCRGKPSRAAPVLQRKKVVV